MKKLTALIGLTLLCGISLALTLNVSVDPSAWDGSLRGQPTAPLLEPGVPALNYYPVRVLIPFGEKVLNVSVQSSPYLLQRDGVYLDYARQQQPTSQPRPDATQPNPAIWKSDTLFPAANHRYLGTQLQRGLQYAVLDLFPWKYNPVSRQIHAASEFSIEIETGWDDALATQQANFYAPALAARSVEGFALNPQALASYQQASRYRNHAPQSRLIDLSTPRQMVIITNSTASSWLQSYANWRDGNDISTGVFQTADIYASYPGTDNAAKVRAFISDAYQAWASTPQPLQYVILGGDDEIVPLRGCYGQVGDTVDLRMPTDLYFSNLDGDWNANGNDIWGEPQDQVDMLPEVHIGRFPAETQPEFENIIRKIQYYTSNSTFSNNTAIMFGENLNNNPLTWGGDYKDEVSTSVPELYHLRTMYQRDGTYSEQGVWNAINEGAHVMNHMGHANQTFLMGQSNGSIQQLQNTEYGFLYTQGCYPAAFDQATSGDGESIAEHMLTASGGVFAFLGNTRYGWYSPGNTNGASQFYDRDYFSGLFQTANNRFGSALSYSRLQNLNAAINYDVMRWCYYQMVLFGDPSIEVKLPDPTLPLLSLESYTIDDVEGDGDGTINPGEIIRIHPVISNHQNWAAAHNVTATLSGLPAGAQLLSDPLVIPQLLPGQTADPGLYFRVQLPSGIDYGSYQITLELQSLHPVTNLSTGTRRFQLEYEITLIDGSFPWDCPVGSKSAPIVFDFDGDGSLDILYTDNFGNSHLLDNAGQQTGSIPAPLQQDVMRSAAYGQLIDGQEPALVLTSRTGKVLALTGDEVLFDYDGGSQFLFTPVIAQIDWQGGMEVVAHSLDGKIHVLDSSGNLLPGFPLDLGSAFHSELAVADIDGDGGNEIIVGCSNGKLHVIKSDGTPLAGFPLQVSGAINGAPTILANRRIAFGTSSHLHLATPEGSLVFSKPISSAMGGSPALADINADGALDIVFGTANGSLYAVSQSGIDLPGFPVQTGAVLQTPPIIADLDDDPNLEILVSSYVNSVYGFNHDGSVLDGFPFQTSFNGCTPSTLCDLDGDGWLKLVSGYSTGVLVLNLRRAEKDNRPWTVYRGSLTRQGSYASTGNVSNPAEEAPALRTSLLQNFPNPFNPSTSIRFQLASEGSVRLAIYNLKGQLVRVLSDGHRSRGSHTVTWDGLDASGDPVSSGVYLYRLQAGGKVQSRRMLLLK